MLEMVFPGLKVSKVSGEHAPRYPQHLPPLPYENFSLFFIARSLDSLQWQQQKRRKCRVFNKSWSPMKFAGYLTWTRHMLFLGNYPSLNRVFMCCHWIKEPKFNDVCALSNTLIFAPECWTCIIRGPDFKIFPEAHKLHLCYKFFRSPLTPKLLPSTLKSYWNPCNETWTQCKDQTQKKRYNEISLINFALDH